MTVLLTKILWYRIKDRDETLTGINAYKAPIVLNNYVDLSATFGIDIKNNILNFTVRNDNNRFLDVDGTIMFGEQDQIKLYAKYTEDGADVTATAWSQDSDSEPDSAYLLKTYYVVEYKETQNDNRKFLQIKCADKTYVMFSKLVTVSIKSTDGLNAPEAIQKAIRYATQSQNGLYTGTGADAGGQFDIDAKLVSESGYITSTRRATKEDGSVNSTTTFPDINYVAIWKPLYEVIKDLSQPEYINDATELTSGNVRVYGRPFIFWVDELNKFHWEYPDQTEDATFVVGTDLIKREDMSKKVFDVINMVIFSAGDDLNGVGIWDYYFDPATDSKSLKMKFASFTEISKQLLEDDYKINVNREAGAKYQYPTDASYPVSAFGATGLADDGDYNDALRARAKKDGRARAESLIKTSNKSKTRWSGTIEIRGDNYQAGDLIKYTSSNQGISEQLLRVTDVHHTFNKNGWFTTLTLEEDPEATIISV